MRIKATTAFPLLAVLIVLVTFGTLWALTAGQTDDFEDGTTQGWRVGSAGAPSPPTNISDGGPLGAGDAYVEYTSTGTGGPGSKMTFFNDTQWTGDYITAGVKAIRMHVNNLGATDLDLRLHLTTGIDAGDPGCYSAQAISLPAGSGWTTVTFPLEEANVMNFFPGRCTYNTVMANVQKLWIYNSPNGFPPDVESAIAATLGMDNVTALTSAVMINEVDADQTSTDNAEFVELYDGGTGNTDLTGLVLVFFNGGATGDGSYNAVDLDGQTTDANGFFVYCGDAANVANCDLEEGAGTTNLIQNGADAVALYVGDATDFPDGTAPTTTNLLDAVAYDTNDADDTALLAALGLTEQFNENAVGTGVTDSNQRIPDGSPDIHPAAPTPGGTNDAALPVELASFEAALDGNVAVLKWRTSSESNNAGFEVQVKRGEAFEALGFVNGGGTTTEARSYEFRTGSLAPGRYVFRLKQLDFDGTITFSPEVELTVETPGAYQLSEVYPNPFNPRASLTLAVAQAQEVTVALYDVQGRRVSLVHTGFLEADTQHTFTIDGANLASGVYVLQVKGATFSAERTVTLLK
ncbi:T9SS type A sorting domain-containing protein [Rhodocaloribacter sp.]